MKHLFRILSLFLVGGVIYTAQAATVPSSGINYDNSQIIIQYVRTTGAADRFSCFGNGTLARPSYYPLVAPDKRQDGVTNADTGDWDAVVPRGNEFDYQIILSLSAIGITSESALADILNGGGNECFQQAGDYYIKFQLEDDAGNVAYYPSSSTTYTDWYQYTVKASNPIGGTRSSDSSPLTEITLSPDPATNPVPADGASAYTATLTFRDEFGNRIVQFDGTEDIDLQLFMDLSDIEIDGIMTDIPPNPSGGATVMTEAIAYNNTGSESLFSDNTLVGNQTLTSLFPNKSILDSNLTKVDDGVFSFNIKSSVPSMKLINSAAPSEGAGVFQQPITFLTDTALIDESGNTTAGVYTIPGLGISNSFAFDALLAAEPTITGNVSWGELEDIDTEIIGNSGTTSTERYILTTPYNKYILKYEEVDAGTGAIVYKDAEQPYSAESDTTYTKELAFFPVNGSVNGAADGDIGIGAHVQYTGPGAVDIRHMSGLESDDPSLATPEPAAVACGAGFSVCYPFVTDTTARIIGADIEGAIQADKDSLFIYEKSSTEIGGAGMGQQTNYLGSTNNNAIKNDLLINVADATRNPNPDAYIDSTSGLLTSGDIELSDIITKFATYDVVIVDGVDLVIDTNPPTDGTNGAKKTVIVKDANIFVSADMNYQNINDSFGIIAFNSDVSRLSTEAPTTGHMFIEPSVKKIVGTYYLDGSLVATDGAQYLRFKGTGAAIDINESALAESDAFLYSTIGLDKQLVLEGVIWSNNTMGGSLISSDALGGNYVSPWNNAGVPNDYEARPYDFHFMRRYDGTQNLSVCTPNKANPLVCDQNDNAFVIRLDYKATYPDTAPPVFKSMGVISR